MRALLPRIHARLTKQLARADPYLWWNAAYIPLPWLAASRPCLRAHLRGGAASLTPDELQHTC